MKALVMIAALLAASSASALPYGPFFPNVVFPEPAGLSAPSQPIGAPISQPAGQ